MGILAWIKSWPIFKQYNYWEWEAGRLYLRWLDLSTGTNADTPRERNVHLANAAGMLPDCKARCKTLGDKMLKAGQSYFECTGHIKGSRDLHRWLELPDGTLLEPTLGTTPRNRYVCTERKFIKAEK